MTSRNPIENLGQSLGEYLREQRTSARLSLRQLAALAGVSNPYLSQIERGVKKPSAEILQQLAKGLQISSESLYVKAGFLDEHTVHGHRPWDVEAAVIADTALTDRQKATLVDIYRSFVGDTPAGASEMAPTPEAPATARTKKAAAERGPAKKAAAERGPAKKAAAKRGPAKRAAAPRAAAGTTKSPARKTSTQTTTIKE
jgi:transcriptional regulator with XRE-family HTH domain